MLFTRCSMTIETIRFFFGFYFNNPAQASLTSTEVSQDAESD